MIGGVSIKAAGTVHGPWIDEDSGIDLLVPLDLHSADFLVPAAVDIFSEPGNGNSAFVGQYGQGQQAAILQVGTDNLAHIIQIGLQNFGWTVQRGEGHILWLAQFGYDNSAVTWQAGDASAVCLTQIGDGNGIRLLAGDGLQVRIVQLAAR